MEWPDVIQLKVAEVGSGFLRTANWLVVFAIFSDADILGANDFVIAQSRTECEKGKQKGVKKCTHRPVTPPTNES